MKNNVLKKVALGILVAGYACGSAWAIEGVSSLPVKGVAPVINDSLGGANKVTFKTLKANGAEHTAQDKLKTGDKIIIEYKLNDVDGDTQGTSSVDNTATTMTFYAKKSDGSMVEFKGGAFEIGANNAVSKVTATIPATAAGAIKIGLLIEGRTQYGYPRNSGWFSVSDIFNEQGDLGIPTDPEDPKPTDPGVKDPGDDNGTDVETEVPPVCDPTDPKCDGDGGGPIEGGETVIIKDANGNDLTDPNSGAEIKPGDEVTVGVKDDTGAELSESQIVAKYNIQWYLSDDNTLATEPGKVTTITGIGADSTGALSGATATKFTLPATNAAADALLTKLSPKAVAGAQGFKLAVDVVTK